MNKIRAENVNILVIIYLDHILIYIDITDHVNTICGDFNSFKKYFLYAHQEKYYFHGDEMQFFGYVMFLQDISMKNKGVKTIHD